MEDYDDAQLLAKYAADGSQQGVRRAGSAAHRPGYSARCRQVMTGTGEDSRRRFS